jgi:hypothetical protein
MAMLPPTSGAKIFVVLIQMHASGLRLGAGDSNNFLLTADDLRLLLTSFDLNTSPA